MKNKRMIGFLLVVSGSFFWGIGGTMAQQLFSLGIEVNWLVSTRLVIAGILLLIAQAIFKDRGQILQIWREKWAAFRLLVFAIIGMLGVQYTYMASIKEGNAAVATLLQYMAPVMIIIWVTVRGISGLRKRCGNNCASSWRKLLFINERLPFCICRPSPFNYLGIIIWCDASVLYALRHSTIKALRFTCRCRLGDVPSRIDDEFCTAAMECGYFGMDRRNGLLFGCRHYFRHHAGLLVLH